ncbi:MAG: IPT/TIG domain-containing protein [Planctomycetes bacterium]|nr:IPT/TIG domain-containing protein [Planctomycetota bacterium]
MNRGHAAVWMLAAMLFASGLSAVTIVGGDYAGADLVPADGDELSGTFTNVGTFRVMSGRTVHVLQGTALNVTANLILIEGTLNGLGRGNTGGAAVANNSNLGGVNGTGTGFGGGGQYGSCCHGTGGGGGAYGGNGGAGGRFLTSPNPGTGGTAHGAAGSPTSAGMGAGGGSGSSVATGTGASGAGGAGGASITLNAGTISLSGTINADGAAGGNATQTGSSVSPHGGGGGSGGGVLLNGAMTLTGSITARGGAGGNQIGTSGWGSGGGGGGGGRIWLNGVKVSQSGGFTTSVTGGAAGTSLAGASLNPVAGSAGSMTDNTTTVALLAEATAGTASNVFNNENGGGDGYQAATFTLRNLSTTITQGFSAITIRSAGTGNDLTDYSEVALYRDANSSGSFELASDTLIGNTATAFSADNGTVSFNVQTGEQDLNASETRRYFVVIKLSGVASPNETFNFGVSDFTAVAGSTKAGVPSVTILGMVIDTPNFAFTDASAASAAMAFLGSSDNVCQSFTIAYPSGPNDKPSTITVTGLGTANESTDLNSVQLWHDSDSSGTYSSTGDTQVDSQTYTLDNGTVTFSMASHANFQAGQTRRFFVVYNLNNNASDTETFQCYVSAAGASAGGATFSGMPAPSVTGTPGLVVSANVLLVTLNGPSAASTVNSNYQGPTSDGALLCDVTLAAAPGGAWTVTSLTFNASGTGNHNTAYSEVALYEDNGNGTWDGTPPDTLAAATATAFTANAVTMTLTNSAFAAGTSRRFYLVGKLNGTATAGQTFNANLQSSVTTPPSGGTVTGIPTSSTTALIIDVASLSVANGPAVATPATHFAGTAASYVVSRWTLTASNSNVNVNAITITTGGTGNWTSDVDGTSGVAVWRDDGDGAFGATTDTLLYQGAGAGTVIATFTSTLSLSNSSSADLWVRVGLTNTAGAGMATAAETFTLGIQNASDVSATGGVTVLLSTPAPNSVTLGAIEFFVTTFDPAGDLPAGGKPITITGSGFLSPLTVTIGGVVCPGTPVITGGTSVTGLIVPPGGGSNLPIVITSGSLGPQTITQRFTYSNVGQVGGGGGGKGGGGGGCETGSNHTPWAVLLAAMAAVAAVTTLRRKRA